MTIFDIGAILLALAAVFGYVNHRFLKLPPTIGLMLIALVSSLGVIAADRLFPSLELAETSSSFIQQIEFSEVLMHGMLSFLLFSGALHINLSNLLEKKWTIGSLATVGVLMSTGIVGAGIYFLVQALSLPFEIPLLHCLIFGALISPTDPISVLGILKTTGASKSLQAKIAGESLFNDGVGVVVFVGLIAAAGLGRQEEIRGLGLLTFFLQEVAGGAVLGYVFGYIAYRALKSINNYQLEVLITLALVMFVYALCFWVHASGPIAVVVAGLLIGNQGKKFAMSEKTADHIEKFWELIDGIMNAVLFLLIGLEILALSFEARYLAVSLAAIPLVLLARWISVLFPVQILRRFHVFSPGAVTILTWGGLRGGISVALALSLPAFAGRDLFLVCTYVIVLFSIVAQGLSIKKVILKFQ